jgi:hypothetical protein
MASIGTSDLQSLPVGPEGGVSMTVRDKEPEAPAQPAVPADTNVVVSSDAQRLQEARENDPAVDIGKVVSGIQTASQQGLLSLPARDVPMTTNHVTQDAQADPNFLPKSDTKDYIAEQLSADEIIRRNAKKSQAEGTGDMLYAELSVPILVAALYFAFQLPAVKKTLATTLPVLFKTDGNPKLTGYLALSVAFGAAVYGATKAAKHLSI